MGPSAARWSATWFRRSACESRHRFRGRIWRTVGRLRRSCGAATLTGRVPKKAKERNPGRALPPVGLFHRGSAARRVRPVPSPLQGSDLAHRGPSSAVLRRGHAPRSGSKERNPGRALPPGPRPRGRSRAGGRATALWRSGTWAARRAHAAVARSAKTATAAQPSAARRGPEHVGTHRGAAA